MIETSLTILDIHTVIARTSADISIVDHLHPSEAAAIETSSPRRRQAFALGRTTARNALAAIGHPVAYLDRAPNGMPQWPKGIHGSISHSGGVAVSIATASDEVTGAGIDVERSLPMPALARGLFQCRDDRHGPGLDAVGLQRLSFSARESAYKALNADNQSHESIADMDVALFEDAGDAGRFHVRSGYLAAIPHTGHWRRIQTNHIVTWLLAGKPVAPQSSQVGRSVRGDRCVLGEEAGSLRVVPQGRRDRI